jgi:hypothetical protein
MVFAKSYLPFLPFTEMLVTKFVKRYQLCYEVNLIIHLGVIALFSSIFYTALPEGGGGYTVLPLSVCPSFRPSVQDIFAHWETGSRNLTGPKTLPTIWGTYMKLVTKYQISVINSC